MTEEEHKTEPRHPSFSDDLKIFVSRIPLNFDETSVRRIVTDALLCGEESASSTVQYVGFVYEKAKEDDPANQRFIRERDKEPVAKTDHHRRCAFVVLQTPELVERAIALKSIRGGAKPGSTKKHRLYIGPCLTDYQKDKTNTKECFLWPKHTCPYGESCKFSHDGPGGPLLRVVAKPKKCRNYRKNKCSLGHECPFSHDFEPKPRQVVIFDESEKDCINWKTKGKCRKREKCPYRHDPALLAKAQSRKSQQGKRQRGSQKRKQPLCVRVFGMNYDTTEDSIRVLFRDCGPVVSVDFPVFDDSQRSKGYCGVVFQSPKAVANAVALSGTELDGRWLSVQAGKMYLEDWEQHHTDNRSNKKLRCE